MNNPTSDADERREQTSEKQQYERPAIIYRGKLETYAAGSVGTTNPATCA